MSVWFVIVLLILLGYIFRRQLVRKPRRPFSVFGGGLWTAVAYAVLRLDPAFPMTPRYVVLTALVVAFIWGVWITESVVGGEGKEEGNER